MEGSQFLQTPPSSEQDDDNRREYSNFAEEEDDDGAMYADDAPSCVSCGHALSLKEKGPKCYPCYREAQEVLEFAHKQPMGVVEEVDSDEKSPKKTSQRCFPKKGGTKRARSLVKKVLNLDEYDDEHDEEETPDLPRYFALFPKFSELDQVVYCRAHASSLSAKSVKNRMRYSKKTGERWANKQ